MAEIKLSDHFSIAKLFSMVIWFSVIAGVILTVLGLLTVGEVARLQGAEGELLKDCLEYGNIVVLIVVFYIVQSEFQYFFTMVEKEALGFFSAVISGVINISLDALFILVFKWGLRGAAFASFLGVLFGARNRDELTSLLKKSIVLLAVINVLLFGITEACAEIFAGIFVGYDKELLDMSVRGLRIYCSVFLLTSFNVFGSAFFTALNDGLNSAIISFARTIVFLVAGVLLLPLIWGLDGIWISTSVAELLALIVTISIGLINRKKLVL